MIKIKNLYKKFEPNSEYILNDINLEIEKGDIFGVIGLSGAGKSTLVRCINGLENPTSGEVIIENKNVSSLKGSDLRELRKDVTMIFQSFNLLSQKKVIDNVSLPLKLQGVSRKNRNTRALELLTMVGLEDKVDSYPSQLSGGQKQRVAIARALATNPKVLLCDEATSALDPETTKSILALLKDINEKLGITIIIITHQMNIVEEICNKVAIIDNGSIAEYGRVDEVFSSSKSDITKRLLFPSIDKEVFKSTENKYLVRIVFNGHESTSTPIVTEMALEKRLIANILYASTKTLSGKLFGNMILSFKDIEEINKAIEYLSKYKNICVEVIKNDNIID